MGNQPQNGSSKTDKTIGFQDVEPEMIDKDPDIALRDLEAANLKTYKVKPTKYKWIETDAGRTATGRNKVGRILRRVGSIALAAGLSALGLNGDVLQAGSTGNNIVQILSHVESIVFMVGLIFTVLFKSVDMVELYSEKADEMEAVESKSPILRKIKKLIFGG